MHTPLVTFIDRLETPAMCRTDVIRWSAPVPAFGDLTFAVVATVGLNPSRREFVDKRGVELQGIHRRFHTLTSLGLRSWADADASHLRLILESCRTYFLGNPYDLWFKKLEQILLASGVSYCGAVRSSACHLDLIPYATRRKWTELSFRQRSSLLSLCADSLALLLKGSKIRVLVLNGQGVVDRFQEVSNIRLERFKMEQWTLKRGRKADVRGFGYKGLLESLCGVMLPHRMLVVGYNHNIQSSFGVTTEAVTAIGTWVAKVIKGAL
jgi:hypothetical protein